MKTPQNKMTVALIWIALYVVSMSVAETLSSNLGIDWVINAPLALALVAALCVYLKRINGWRENGFDGSKAFPYAQTLFCLPLIVLSTLNLWRGVGTNGTPLEMALHVVAMLCVGFIEEVIFRGFLFHAMLQQSKRTTAILVSSATFGLGHIVNLLNGAELLPTLLQVVYAIAIGLMLTVFVFKTNRIVPCIIFHSVFNALSTFTNEVGRTIGYGVMVCVIITVISVGYAAYLWFRVKDENAQPAERTAC